MHIKAPLEYVWRPLFDLIGGAWRSVRFFPDGLLIPLLLVGVPVFFTIFAVLVMQ